MTPGGSPPLLTPIPLALVGQPNAASAIGALRHLAAEHADEARARAAAYASTYAGRRGAMVFDVVASRQQRYLLIVLPKVAAWEALGNASLTDLAETPPTHFSLREAEAVTMSTVAAGLLRFGQEHGLVEDESIAAGWAEVSSAFCHAHRLDPWVGQVSGIGPALYAYLRMRCGADALKR